MPAIPLRGDRAAYDAASYRLLHANDIDSSASSIHHTLGSGAYQAASGSHTHGESLSTLYNHSHSGSATGDGGKLDWDNIWSDAVHNHNSDAEGGILTITASNLSSGAAVGGYVLTADGFGNSIWSPTSAIISSLNSLTDVHVPAPDDGNVLTWNAASGSWIAYPLFDWRVTLTQDETTDDSDKTFTVPMDEEWQILWIWVEFTSTATAGIRQVEVQLQDASSNVIGQFQSGVSQSEGLTYKYLFGIGVADLTSLRDYNNVTTPLPAGTFLSGGQKIRIWDNNAVDASADDMVVRVQYASRSFRIENYYVVSVNNSGHAQTSGGVVFTQYQVLSMKDASQLQTSGSIVLTYRYATLVVQDSAHVLTSETPTLTYNIILQLSYVYSTTHLHTTGDIAFTQYHILVVQSTSQKLTNESVTLSLNVQHFNIPAVTNTEQAQTAQNTELTYRQQLDIQNSAHVQTVDNTGLSTDIHVLTIHDSSQLQTSGNISSMFTNKPVLGVKSSAHSQTSGKVTFSNMTTLEVNSSAHSQTSDSAGTLTQHQKELSVHNSSMKLITEKVTLFAP